MTAVLAGEAGPDVSPLVVERGVAAIVTTLAAGASEHKARSID